MKIQAITFEKQKGFPIYKQIYEKLKHDMLHGYLQQGDQLPSIRQCVKQWRVSKTSIERAYDLLLVEGFLVSIPQKGFYVDVDENHRMLRKQLLDHKQEDPKQIVRYDFRSQTMDKDAFDTSLWKRYLKEVLEQQEEIVTYGEAQGEYALRLALTQYGYAMRGLLTTPEHLLIGASFQSLLYLLCGFLPKDSVIGMEEGGFPQAEQVFLDYGLKVIKLAIEDDGIPLQELKRYPLTVLYVHTGSMGRLHQPLSVKKRKELLEWARSNHTMIIEDDHNGELRYASKPLPCMQSFDMGEHVIYIGSFSKLLLPSLRISYLVLPQCFAARYDATNYGPTASKIEQLALARYISDGHLEKHVKRLRKRYEIKSETMQRMLRENWRQDDFLLEEAGLQLILRFPKEEMVKNIMTQCNARHILVNQRDKKELVLSFAAISLEEMQEAMQELIQLFQEEERAIASMLPI